LVFRIVADGNDQDWHRFLGDYWLPVCRFAQQRGKLTIEDAEDVAAETFEVVLRNKLLQRWIFNRSSKLRTLLCTVVRHILSNRARKQKRRMRLLRKNLRELLGRTDLQASRIPDRQFVDRDEFYAAWIEGILLQALRTLMQEYQQQGKVRYFRVLHRRVCEKMTASQVSSVLGLKRIDAQNYYKAACKRLRTKLKELVHEHVRRYSDPQDLNDEFDSEWREIARYLREHGGLGQAIAEVYARTGLVRLADRRTQAVASTAHRLAQAIPKVSEPSTNNCDVPANTEGNET
jgi:RNA polymerase sigma factor (sigma-70 family)